MGETTQSLIRDFVGFTDESGRTSCATTEEEHYRLRCLGLVRIASAVEKVYITKHRDLQELQGAMRGLPQVPEEYEAWDSKCPFAGYSQKSALYRRRIAVLGPQRDAASAKYARVEAELEPILYRYGKTKEMCNVVSSKLPQELMDNVYSHIDDFKQPILIDYHFKTVFLRQGSSFEIPHMPWYLDTKIVTPDFAVGSLKSLYHNTTFIFQKPGFVQRFLNDSHWKYIPGVVTKDHVRHLNIWIDLSDYATEPPSLVMTETLMMHLECLRQLKPVKVHITFDLKSNYNATNVGTEGMLLLNRLSLLTMGRLWPLMAELRAKGQVVTMAEWDINWIWTPKAGEISLKMAQEHLQKHLMDAHP